MEQEKYWQNLDNDPKFLNWFKVGWGQKIAEKKFGEALVAEYDRTDLQEITGKGEVPDSLQEIKKIVEEINDQIEPERTFEDAVKALRLAAAKYEVQITDEEIQEHKHSAIENMIVDSERGIEWEGDNS